MAMVCPQCNGTFDGVMRCPKCNVGLNFQAARTMAAISLPPSNKAWHQSPAGRVMVGALIAVGMSYGLLQLSVTLLRVLGKTGADALTPPVALGLFYGLQGVAVLVAGVLAGVARRQGFTYGAAVGMISGGIALGAILSGVLSGVVEPFSSNLLHTGTPAKPVELIPGIAVHTATLYGLPLLHLLCGGLGGLVGGFLFRPPPEVGGAVLLATESEVPKVGLSTAIDLPPATSEKPSMLKGKISWFKCMAGVAFAVSVGVFGPKPVQNFIEAASEGALKVSDHQQEYVTAAEVFALAIFIGGTIAGAGRFNGLKQGLVVGVGAGLGMIPFIAKSPDQSPVYILLSAIFIAPLGGWFGSSLLPPPPPARLTHGALD